MYESFLFVRGSLFLFFYGNKTGFSSARAFRASSSRGFLVLYVKKSMERRTVVCNLLWHCSLACSIFAVQVFLSIFFEQHSPKSVKTVAE
ncbi:hypothetical protein Psal006b_00099 [Piscirickettsia salmonis]|uniref:Cell death suppressor protein Lls1 n=1 Tax=Piscirickettsia salmonis TaxID=1238 RepID=A0AAC8VKJ8_PISSA|nr:cell death suppressor protein Lls1 [Piscirickettsia salmonis]QGN97159.1 hypothetical protein Psal006b_00099 [Piscirickettsia salmonis]QGO00755.1 hypothetical protein Psal008_00102 [Piscirickettsia salmonis]QGO11480.1 hypothetical protein Psal010b_00099 [Piscirickettsia salmonis]QGO18502.1 hypothetical protein Psal013_00101 [Piscirickettsia salmonis]